VTAELFEHYLGDRTRRAAPSPDALSGAAGGAACGDLVRISLTCDAGVLAAVRWDAEGCGATTAAAAATCELAEGYGVLDAARIGASEIEAELGGLAPERRHAAGLAADALHRALANLAASGAPLAPASRSRVLVAISGGVDSAVAAWLERESDAEVACVTLKLWSDRRTDGERSCCSPEAVVAARALAHSIGLPHLTLDLEEAFRAGVVEPFVAGHAAGRTPNPCVRCNGEVRIDAMVSLADRLGAAALATGHYARVADDGAGPLLARAADDAKDQTYMLSALPPAILARLRFPLGELTKPRVRELARGAGLAVADKRESQDLCFLAGEGKRAFLRRHAGVDDADGEVLDSAGRVLGRHPGHQNFTVGQRRGLGVAGGEPLYVLRTDAARNRVVVGPREELATRRVEVRGAILHRPGSRVDRVKLRYRSQPIACQISPNGQRPGAHRRLTLALDEPVQRAAPGQTACLMDGDLVVGHGTIA
jgi:tRNA-specific 2-thiouridylase